VCGRTVHTVEADVGTVADMTTPATGPASVPAAVPYALPAAVPASALASVVAAVPAVVPAAADSFAAGQVARAERLRALHVPGDPLVLVNVWDVLGARVVAAQGGAAIATASWAIAAALGLPDGEAMSLADNLTLVSRIAAAVDLPVTADLERGYASAPEDVMASVGRLVASGAVGCNLEDSLVAIGASSADSGLRPVDEQCARLASARRAGERMGIPLVLNARTDAMARGGSLDDAVARGLAYLAAGADCVFVVGALALPDVAALAEAFDGRLNVLGRPGQPSLADLAAAGVCRVSIGSSGPGVAYAAFARAAAQLLAGGDYVPDQAYRLPL